jgi:hypothetical protein
MLVRPILSAEIKGHPAARSLRIVSPADFRVDAWEETRQPSERNWLPYCLDVRERRSLYCRAGSVREARRAPFYYLHLRRRATRLLSVPWERGRVIEGDAPSPCFIFSIGRCGSTLLVNALRAGGACAVSEPDFHTQGVATSIFEGPLYPGYGELSHVLSDLTNDLLAALSEGGGSGFIKLRAECCKAPRLIIGNRAIKSIFLIREFSSWAASTLKVSTISARSLIDRYIEGVRALQWLKQNTDCHLVTYEGLASREVAAVGDLAAFVGLPLEDAKMKAAMAVDSQAGSPLSRKSVSEGRVRTHLLEEAKRSWTTARPAELLEELGLGWY